MYTILRIYTDYTTMTEEASNISQALTASAIYLEDPNCIGIKIWDIHNGEIILDFWRDCNE